MRLSRRDQRLYKAELRESVMIPWFTSLACTVYLSSCRVEDLEKRLVATERELNDCKRAEVGYYNSLLAP